MGRERLLLKASHPSRSLLAAKFRYSSYSFKKLSNGLEKLSYRL